MKRPLTAIVLAVAFGVAIAAVEPFPAGGPIVNANVLKSVNPTGAATSANQDLANAALSSVDSSIDVALSSRASESTASAVAGSTASIDSIISAVNATLTQRLDVALSTRTAPADIQHIRFGDTQDLDSFGRVKMSQPFGVFDNKQIHTRNTGDWEERIWGAIITHGAVSGVGFSVGETITGASSVEIGTVTAVAASSVTYSTTDGNDFTDGETITGGTTGSTATVLTHNTGADISYQYDRSSTFLSVGTVAGQRVIRQSVRYLPYVPGKGISILTTEKFGAGKVGVTQCVMYGDDLNGIGVCLVGTTVNILARTSTSGSPVDTLIPQSSWNIDKLDGSCLSNCVGTSNPSGLTLDITKVQISGEDLQWLGVGRERISLNIDGKAITVHEIRNANSATSVYMKTPSLPIRYEVVNTGTTASATTLEQICTSVASEGGYALPGQEFTAGNGTTRVAVTTRRPIFAIRLKNNFPSGEPNRRTVRFLDWEVSARTNDAFFELIHVHNPSAITATWTSVDALSAVEYSTNISAISGMMTHKVQSSYVASGQGNSSNSSTANSEFVSNHSFLSQNFESTNSQAFVIYATSESGTSNVASHISFIESE